MLSDQTIITVDLIKKIYQSEYSKIPIYHDKNKNDILGKTLKILLILTIMKFKKAF